MKVLWWNYGDGDSDCNIVRVYEDDVRGEEDFLLVCDDETKKWHLDDAPVVESAKQAVEQITAPDRLPHPRSDERNDTAAGGG